MLSTRKFFLGNPVIFFIKKIAEKGWLKPCRIAGYYINIRKSSRFSKWNHLIPFHS